MRAYFAACVATQLNQTENIMSILSYVKFPYQMPDGYIQVGEYETKDLTHLGHQMMFCLVSEDGRLICEEEGDLQLDGTIAIWNSNAVYELDFEAGTLKRVGIFNADGGVSKQDFNVANYHTSGATK